MALNMDLINKTAQGAVGNKYKLVQTTPKPLKVDMAKVKATADAAIGSMNQPLKTPTLRVSGGGAANEGAGAGSKTKLQELAGNLGYGFERSGAKLLGFGEGIGDAIVSNFWKGAEGLTSGFGLAPNNLSKYLGTLADKPLENDVTQRYEQSIERRYNPTDLQRKIGDYGEAAVGMLPAIAAGTFVAPAAGLLSLGVSAAGQSAQQAKSEGATTSQALNYGTASGLLETGIESIAGAIPGLPKGRVTSLIQSIVKSPVASKLIDILGEGGEEALSTFLTPYLQRLTYDKDAASATGKEIAESAIVGAALAGIMQGANAVSNIGTKAKPLVTPQLNTQTQQAASPVKSANITPKTTQTVQPTSDTTQQPFAEINLQKPTATVATQNATQTGAQSVTAQPEKPFVYTPDTVSLNGKTWYHGTGTTGLDASKLDPNMTNIDGLLGNGIYLTDDAGIAEGYAKDRGRKTKTPTVYQASVNTQNIIDMEKPMSDDVYAEFRKALAPWENYGADVSRIDALQAKGASGIDIYKAFSDELSDVSYQGQISKSEFYDTFDELNFNLSQLGYEGYTHQGGKIVGKKPHQVLVLLDPTGRTYETNRSQNVITQFAPKASEPVTAQPIPARQAYTDSAGKTLTSNQSEYFKDSKARDSNGKLLVVHHGTKADFSVFDFTKGGSSMVSNAMYFTKSKQKADSYGENGKTISAYLKIDNPIYFGGKNPTQFDSEWRDAFNSLNDESFNFDEVAKKTNYAIVSLAQHINKTVYNGTKSEAEILRDYFGFDGTIDGDDYSVFSPEQIKSVDNASPTNSPDIYEKNTQAVNAPSDTLTSNPTQSVGAATAGWNPYNQMLNQYGAIPEGEGPIADTRVVSVPKQTSDDEYVMQTMRTAQEAPATPDSLVPQLEQAVLDNLFSKKRKSDVAALYYAEEAIRSKGYSTALKDWTADVRKGNVSKELTALGWTLYNNAANSGNAKEAVDILVDLSSMVRSGAQAVQAVRLLKKMAPESRLYAVQRSVQNLQDDLVGKYGKDAPNLKIDADLADKFINAKTDAERNAALREIYRNIGSQLPSTFGDRWNAWRYLSMLGNVRTHVRNIGSNFVFAGVRAVKNTIAKGLETAVIGDKEGRTKAFLTVADKALIEAAYADYATVADEITAYGKYNEAQDEIQRGRVIFRKGLPTKALEKITGKTFDRGLLENTRNFNNTALDTEDVWVSRPAYARALAGYMKANNISADTLNANGDAVVKARAYAVNEARKASFRDSNAFSDMVSSIGKQGGRDKSFMQKATNVVVEGVLPFKRTPANILVRAFEYSPIGLAKGLTYDLTQVKSGEMTASQAIDNISSGITGTLVVGLGALLASMGLISVGGSDDEKQKSFEELQGAQDYSLIIGDTAFSIDWLAPSAVPLFVGVEIYNRMTDKSENGITLKEALDAISRITNPVLETSMLQSLNDVLSNVSYADAPLYYLLSSAATSYLGQLVPTLGGQIARTIDDTRRTTYVDKNTGTPDELQYFAQKTLGKIPFASQTAQPYVDMWGREEVNANPLSRAAQNLVSPSYVSKLGSSDMEKELQRLYDIDSASGVLPSKAPKYVEDKGTRYDMTAAEYTQYQKTRGQTAYNTLIELTASKEYKSLTDEGKADVIKDAYSYAAEKAKDELLTSRKVKHETAAIVIELDGAVKNKITPTQFLTTKRLYTAPPATETQTGAQLQVKRLTPLLTPDLGKYVKETKTQESAADLARLNLLQRKDLTAQQKSYLDTALIGELKAPRDYTNEDKFILSMLTASQQKKYDTVQKRLGFTPRQYSVYLSAMSKPANAVTWGKFEKINALKAAGLPQDKAYMLYTILS